VKGVCGGRNFLAPPYYSQRAVFASPLSTFVICVERRSGILSGGILVEVVIVIILQMCNVIIIIIIIVDIQKLLTQYNSPVVADHLSYVKRR